MAPVIRNPVLPGFHPDPSFLRVGDDYYLATSTFEWYPGVRIHHSRDLVHWRPLGGVLTDRRLLDLAGCWDSAGVWAPDLTYVDGRFHLVYSNVSSYHEGFKDSPNFLITAADITGPWSDPIPLHARGFDASLFHDEDGSTWIANMVFDWRPGRKSFGGIEIQRFDRAAGKLIGEPILIFRGTDAGVTEGPHLYRKDGWYYLLVAEGGTGYRHQITLARSRSLFGPYEADPAGPVLTAHDRPDLPIQKAGHGCLVETPTGEWYLSYLLARPYTERGPCVLGRETGLQRAEWTKDGWLRVPGGRPTAETPAPALAPAPWPEPSEVDDFDELRPEWSTLRRPATPDWLSLTERPSHLRIHGGESPQGRFAPSLVARPVTNQQCELATTMEFRPTTFQHLAGITAYYNQHNWHYLYVTADDEGRPILELLTRDQGKLTMYPDLRIDAKTRLDLRVRFDGPTVRFAYGLGNGWQEIPVELDATMLSDEHADEFVDGQARVFGFTGAFVGLWVQDLTGLGLPADFDRATYREN